MSKNTTIKTDLAGESGTNGKVPGKTADLAPAELVKGTKKPLKKSSVSQIDAAERSAVGAVRPRSSRAVRGSSGLANTGTIISYDD